ncbi:MAG: glycosyltransferase family 2 protein [Cyanobacteria bacterium]|nr:glycosyltransferase family 2 protein [Cyanobacteriota bacterium]
MNNLLVSVIITTKNSSNTLKACLESVTKQTYRNFEIIVVDNNSSDDTKEIAYNYANKVFNKGPERSLQRNYGVEKSEGKYVLILDSDMMLTNDVIKSCIEKINSDNNYKAIVIPESSFGLGFWAQCKKLERSFYVGVEWMEAARFFNKNIFIELDGYDIENTGTEDYDLPHRIKHKYGKNSVRRIEYYINHNEQKISLLNLLRKKFYYGKDLRLYNSRSHNRKYFRNQSSIAKRYKIFLSNPGKLFKNPILGLGMLFMKMLEFLSLGFGYLLKNRY